MWAAIGPREFAVTRAEALDAFAGYVRQLIGWRDYIWNLYWYFGEAYRHNNELDAHTALPTWFAGLDADAVEARVCAMCWLRCAIAAGYITFRG